MNLISSHENVDGWMEMVISNHFPFVKILKINQFETTITIVINGCFAYQIDTLRPAQTLVHRGNIIQFETCFLINWIAIRFQGL